MAGELQADWATGKTVYFLLRDGMDKIWNGVTFVAYNAANYATYAIAATEDGGGGYYKGNMPAAAAGVYSVVAKNRAGGSPAESDLSVADGDLFWDGSAVGISVAAIAAAALASLFRRSMSLDEAAAAAQSLCGAILKLTSAFSVKDAAHGNNAVTYRSDGVTPFMAQVPATDATLTPVRSLGVGS